MGDGKNGKEKGEVGGGRGGRERGGGGGGERGKGEKGRKRLVYSPVTQCDSCMCTRRGVFLLHFSLCSPREHVCL